MTPTKSYYTSGQLEYEGFINGEIQVGHWTFYHENGKVFSKGEFDEKGLPIGIWTEYYESGQIKYEAISPQGNLFSLDSNNLEIINYWTENGKPLIVDGNGKLLIHFENGNIRHKSYWNNKLKNGTLQEFYENGQLNIEKNFKDGLKNGIGKVFSKNGTIICESYYLNGKPIGKLTEWYESGQIAEEGEYINGEYVVNNFWSESGEQLLIDGTGTAVRIYGATDGDIYEQHFDNGKMLCEKKIAGVTYGQFIPNK